MKSRTFLTAVLTAARGLVLLGAAAARKETSMTSALLRPDTTTVKARDVLFVPAGTIHSVKNLGSGNGAELATYVVEKGKPLITLALR